MKYKITFIFFFILCGIAHSQRLQFKIYSTSDGLSQSIVQNFYQDEKGQMWIGTADGLNVFDGVSWRTYRLEDGLPDNRILQILQDKNKIIWVLTYRGLARVDPLTEKIFPFRDEQGLLSNNISSGTFTPDGKIWVQSSEGIHLIDPEPGGGRIIQSLKINVPIRTLQYGGLQLGGMYQGKSGTLWVATSNGLYTHDANSGNQFTINQNLPSIRFNMVTGDRKGRIWVASGDKGIFILEKGKQRNLSVKDGLAGNTVWSIYIDRSSNIWVGTTTGLSLLIENKDNTFSIESYTTRNGLSSDRISSVYEDREGNIWIGTFGGGVNKLIDRKFLNYSVATGLPNNFVYKIFQDLKGDMWFGTLGGGIVRFHENQFDRYYNSKNGLRNDQVSDIHQMKDGSYWIALEGVSLARLKDGQFNFYSVSNGLPDEAVRELFVDRSGTFWVGTNNGIAYFQNDRFVPIQKLNNISIGRTLSFYEDSSQTLWIGTEGNGLFRWKKKEIIYYGTKSEFPSLFIRKIVADKRGILWFGTIDGVVRYDGKNFRLLTKKDGLTDNSVWSLLADRSGNLWIGTSKGVDKYNGSSFVNYSSKNGLVGDEVNRNALFEANDRKIWIGTVSGASAYFPQRDQPNQVPPNIILNNFYIFNKKSDFKKGVSLTYHQNDITFSFVGVSFKDESDVRYSYFLKGYDKNWSELTPIRTARFTNLSSGKYEFLVKARNRDGYWSEIVSFPFTITPPYWEQTWFFILVALVVVGIVYQVDRYRVFRIRSLNKVLEQRVIARTQELREAKDLIENLFVYASEAILTVDGNGRILNWNDEAQRLFGWSLSEVNNKSIEMLEPGNEPRNREKLVEIIQYVAEGNTVRSIERHQITADQRLVEVIVSASPVKNAEGRVIAVSLIMLDIGERKRLEKEVVAKEKIVAAVDTLQKTLATIAHYINNSMAAIFSSAELAQMNQEYIARLIDTCFEQSKRVIAVIRSLQKMARSAQLRSADYAGESDSIFDIARDLQKFMEETKDSKKKIEFPPEEF